MHMIDTVTGIPSATMQTSQASASTLGSGNVKWIAFDVVDECLASGITPKFKSEKRFYRLNLKGQCGIYDLRTQSFWQTTKMIFKSSMEAEYRKAGNSLAAMEVFARKCSLSQD